MSKKVCDLIVSLQGRIAAAKDRADKAEAQITKLRAAVKPLVRNEMTWEFSHCSGGYASVPRVSEEHVNALFAAYRETAA